MAAYSPTVSAPSKTWTGVFVSTLCFVVCIFAAATFLSSGGIATGSKTSAAPLFGLWLLAVIAAMVNGKLMEFRRAEGLPSRAYAAWAIFWLAAAAGCFVLLMYVDIRG